VPRIASEIGARPSTSIVPGIPPSPSFPNGDHEVDIFSTPGARGKTHTVSFTAKGVRRGRWKNCAEMNSDFTFGTTLACVDGTVDRLNR
jgi:hypothetical protein